MIDDVQKALEGIVAAAVTPFLPDGTLDLESLRRHLTTMISSEAVSGLVVNANAGEVLLLTQEERNLCLEMATQLGVRYGKPVVTGVPASSPTQALEKIAIADQLGASGALLYPSDVWGAGRSDDAVYQYVETVGAESSLPIVLFQFPFRRANLSYDAQLLARIAAAPSVVGIKDSVWEVARFEQDRRAVAETAPHVRVATGCDEHVLYTMIAGASGAILSLASLCASGVEHIHTRVRTGDLRAAKATHDGINPVVRELYVKGGAHRRARIKAALVALGQIEYPTVRAPLAQVSSSDVDAIADAIRAVPSELMLWA